MSVACVDTSVLTAIAFDEPGTAALAGRLDEFTRLVSSNLLEAELRAAFAREEGAFPEGALAGIDWIQSDRPLAPELAAALEAGYLRGADLWHAANALYATPRPESLSFATLDLRQGTVAEALGFLLLPEGRPSNRTRRPRRRRLRHASERRCRGRPVRAARTVRETGKATPPAPLRRRSRPRHLQ